MQRFTLVLILVFFIWQPAVYAQVNTERRAINSPFLTDEEASLLEVGMLSIGLSRTQATACHTIKVRRGCIQRRFLTSSSCSL
ncbi:MAG TPA: hypothetical protein VHM88_16580 [Candidatus Acidoferrales bacterium]|jgi:hypothetical protein|nr:hypothetical protein [Candidatus Acidoferrales bacterium]